MYNNQYMIDNLSRQKERIDDMIKNYQSIPQAPINNIINTGQQVDNLFELKKLNDGDEVENIAILKNTLFLGEDRMQIKKMDGSIEKYEIKKIYPRDKRDDKIDELNKKIEELEMKLNEPRTNNANSETIQNGSRQEQNATIISNTSTTRTSEPI